MAVVRGKVYWAAVHTPDTTFTPQYKLELEVDKVTADSLAEQGLRVKEPDEEKNRGYTIRFKRNAIRSDGTSAPKPNVVDAYKNKLEQPIGNGSIANVQYRVYDWSFAGKTGKSADLMGVQVLKLVAYAADEFDVEEEAEAPVPMDDGVKVDEDVPF